MLADVLTGANPRARYFGSKVYTRLKVAGVEVASMGLVETDRATDEVIQVIEDRRGIYRKLIVRDGKLAGAMLVGDAEAAPTLIRLYDRDELLPPNRLDVLCLARRRGRGPFRAARRCATATTSANRRSPRRSAAGRTTLSELSRCTKAGTGCGSCRRALARP